MINIVGVIYITRTSAGRAAAFYARRLGETTQPVWVNEVGQGMSPVYLPLGFPLWVPIWLPAREVGVLLRLGAGQIAATAARGAADLGASRHVNSRGGHLKYSAFCCIFPSCYPRC